MRDILHCDLNNFFASVECKKRPELKKVPMAVAGDPKLRHGIILAKNEIAKKYGIVTAETVYSAKKKCPRLVLVEACYDDYVKYSKIINNIYLRYTDRVEPFGIDESFLDVTESKRLFGTPLEIANKIREEVKNETGLTISVGVSFNKSLAKLGSDLKKPDATTVISYNDFKNKIYFLPVEMLLFVGKSTKVELNKLGIKTIGDLARYDRKRLIQRIGKIGGIIHNYACGIDDEEVKKYNSIYIPKSISGGKTFAKDLNDFESISDEMLVLIDEIAFKLRKQKLKCNTVSITIKNDKFISRSKQKVIPVTNSFDEISKNCTKLLKLIYNIGENIRAITVSASNLVGEEDIIQMNIFDIMGEDEKNTKKNKALMAMDSIREKYGYNNTKFGSLIKK